MAAKHQAQTNELPSTRSFGLLFAAIFLIIGLWPVIFHGDQPNYLLLLVAMFFGIAPFAAPQLLLPFNWLWAKLGSVLHHIVNPILMGLIYFGIVVPMGLWLKIRKFDLLHLRWEPDAQTYWIFRDPPGPAPGSMSKQF